jgi:hypothetical protein
VSTQTLREHYGFWRWRIERQSSNRLVKRWAQIGSSSLHHAAKVSLANVAWALASFEQSYDILREDIVRAEMARNTGVPPAMAVISGPHQNSLDYRCLNGWILAMCSLRIERSWTASDTCGILSGAKVRHGLNQTWSASSRHSKPDASPELSTDSMRVLAIRIAHLTWDPEKGSNLDFQLYWKGTDLETLDFAEADLRGSLKTLVEETLRQVYEFFLAVLQPHTGST